jgi:putative sterol carrier protein
MLAYHTPEWVSAIVQGYNDNPDNQKKHFKGMTLYLVVGNVAEPEIGIDKTIYHSAHVVDGALQDDTAHISKEEAEEKADFVLTAPLEVWKKVIQKQEAFVSAFMTGRIRLEKGEAPKIIALAPKAPYLVDVFGGVETEWPDEMSPERLEKYRAEINEFRAKSGV